jgi:uncharacterized protein (UPF0548 family)
VFSLRKPSAEALARLVADQAGRELTYSEHGATATATSGEGPPGYRHDQWRVDLGEFTQERFDRLAQALLDWRIQRGSGLAIFPAEAVRPGLHFALSFRAGIVYVIATGRVVYVTSEPGRSGFAYGTLPAHPEQGEEAFHVEKDGSRLVFRVVAFSRPRDPLAKLGAPVSRALQWQMNQRYLRAARKLAG